MRYVLQAIMVAALGAGLGACVAGAPEETSGEGVEASEGALALQPFQEKRINEIKAAALSKGVTNPVIIAGVAYLESGNLAQCLSENPIHCPGPFSEYCGGPVLAGSGDGPCDARQGGLGMFQFDSGTYDQTLAEHGASILSAPGNIAAGVDFIINKVYVCPNTPDFGNDVNIGHQKALEFINRARPGTAEYNTFMEAMAWCYNGCAPGGCNTAAQAAKYDNATREMLAAKGEAFWFGGLPKPGQRASGSINSSVASTYSSLGGKPGDVDASQGGGFLHPWPDTTGCETQNFSGTKKSDGSVDTGSAGILQWNPRQNKSYWVRGQVFKQYVGMDTVGLGCAIGDEEAFSESSGVTGFRQRFERGTVTWDHVIR